MNRIRSTKGRKSIYLVLVELLEVISAHVWDTLGLSLVVVGGITNNTDLLLWAWDVWESRQVLGRRTCIILRLARTQTESGD